MTQHAEHILLIVTVGGSIDPVVRSILQLSPERVVFIHSNDSQPKIDQVCAQLVSCERHLNPGCIDLHRLNDPQSFTDCVSDMRKLATTVRDWSARGEQYVIVADITGGTKAMSAALALVAHRWPNTRFSYIGGDKRDKDGLGVVATGHEAPILQVNPWHALAYQPLQDAVHLFNHQRYPAIHDLLEPLAKSQRLPDHIKSQLRALLTLAEAYRDWDAFQHKPANNKLKLALKHLNDLDAALPGHNLRPILDPHRDLTQQLAADAQAPSTPLIHDLLANADRRAAHGQYDDATARLYRAAEAIAQHALHAQHDINAARCHLSQLPDTLKTTWKPRADGNGNLKLGLQDGYTLLRQLQHPLAQQFHQLKLDDHQTSPLASRNQSILAHGLKPTTKAAYDALRSPIHQLAGNPDLRPFRFPSLPDP